MIELQELTKEYGNLCAPPSRKLAVDGISAIIRPGVVTGVLPCELSFTTNSGLRWCR
jgi:ABC-type multidrug transport system ATPase subunit